jgi:hypothetical protein
MGGGPARADERPRLLQVISKAEVSANAGRTGVVGGAKPEGGATYDHRLSILGALDLKFIVARREPKRSEVDRGASDEAPERSAGVGSPVL